jgi:hypothetical protein
MPVYLTATDAVEQAAGCRSVLIVPCRFCPAASCAVQSREPYIEPLRRMLKTAAYERFIKELTGRFEKKGLETSVFKSRLLHQFVLCMWTSRRRNKLLKRAAGYDAVVVLGCEAAGETVRRALRSTDCKVIQGMESAGIMSIKPVVRLPGKLSLQLESITRGAE